MKLEKLLPVIGVVLFVYIVWTVGIEKIFSSLMNVDIVLIAVSIVLIFPYLLLQTHKWRTILSKQKIFLDFFYLFKIQIIGIFYGFITPGRIGSFIKIHYIRKKIDIPLGKISSSVVIDRIFDILTLLILSLIGLLLYINYFFNSFLTILFLFVFSLIMIVVFSSKKRSEKILRIFYSRFMPLKYKTKTRHAFHSFYDNIPNYRSLIKPFLYSMLNWVLITSQSFVIAMAFGIDLSYFVFILILPISTVVSLVPITVAGLGTREISLIGLFSLFNISAGKTVAYSIFSTVIYFLFIFIFFLIIINSRSIKE